MAKNRKPNTSKSIINRRATFDYDLKEDIVAGIVLSGAETKSLRMGHGHLRGAFANIKDGELWLYNATITPMLTNRAHLTEDMQTQPRKLLVKQRELAQLQAAKQQGLTIVPVKFLTQGRYIKVVIAPGRGQKKYDKRHNIKTREAGREAARAIKMRGQS